MCKPFSFYVAGYRPTGIWFSILFFLATITVSAQTITTLAGNDSFGDDGAATVASLYYPTDVTVDTAGNLYIDDTENHHIRKASGLAAEGFAITGVSDVSCISLSPTSRRLSFTPTYSGGTGAPISFSVVNEMLPTTSPGPYNLTLYTDNPIIQMRAEQAGISTWHAYNWLAACQNPATPLTITGVSDVSCISLSPTSRRVSFTPTYSGGTGAPISFSVVNEMLPTTSPGPYNLTLYTDNPIIQMRAEQAGVSAWHAHNWMAACQNPAAPLTITGVMQVSCTPLSATSRRVSFTPTYSGGTGAPISFSVVNEMLPTTSPGPYNLTLYTDNPIIQMRAEQAGISTWNAHNWMAACQANARMGAGEVGKSLRVVVLSNPTVADEVSVEIGGAVGALTLSVFDSRGHRVSEKSPGQPVVGPVRTTVGLGQWGGVYLLRVQTPTQSQVVKVVRE